MMPERAKEIDETLLSDDELIENAMKDPDVRERALQLKKSIAAGDESTSGIRGKELQDFLRDHG